MSVRRAQAEIDSAEYAEWIAFHSIEPFSYERSENMLCLVAAILANTHRDKGTRAYKPDDFKPQYGRKRVEDSVSIEMKLRAIFKHGDNK